MNCPSCNASLSEITHQGVTVDVCPGCRGVWLDPGELALLSDTENDLPKESDSRRTAPGQGLQSKTDSHCPRCQAGFDTFEYAPGTSLYIDRCKDCEGIWLDAGELKKIRNISHQRRFLSIHSPTDPQRRLQELLRSENRRSRAQMTQARTATSTAASGSSSRSGRSSTSVYFFQLLTGLPVEVDAKRERFPAATLGLIVVCLMVFLYQTFAVYDPMAFLHQYGMIPGLVTAGDGLMGLFTSLFVHGGWLHLLGNLYFLWLFGDNVEDRLHRGVFLLFYLGCGLVADFCHVIATNMPYVPTVGASGAISGIMGAYLVLYPKRKMYQVFWFIQFRISVAFYLMIWLGLQLFYSSLAAQQGSGAGVAWWAHIGGFGAGALGIWIFNRAGWLRPEADTATDS